jgi:hypothetical protein
MHNPLGVNVCALKQKKEESVHDAVEKIKISDAEVISEKRMEIIRGYAKWPGGPAGIKIKDEKVFQEFQDKNKDIATRPWMPNLLKRIREEFDKYGEIPLSQFSELVKQKGLSRSFAKNFLLDLTSEAGIVKEPFIPKDEKELSFFIGEAAHFSSIFKGGSLLRRHFYTALKYSDTTIKKSDFYNWYNTEGGKLSRFSGEQRASLLGCGLTADWINKLKLSDEEAVETAKEYPTKWRDKTSKRILYS